MKGERCSIQLPELWQFYVLSSQELLKRLQGILIMYPPELGNSDTEFVFFFPAKSHWREYMKQKHGLEN